MLSRDLIVPSPQPLDWLGREADSPSPSLCQPPYSTRDRHPLPILVLSCCAPSQQPARADLSGFSLVLVAVFPYPSRQRTGDGAVKPRAIGRDALLARDASHCSCGQHTAPDSTERHIGDGVSSSFFMHTTHNSALAIDSFPCPS